ncbi:GIY-YIG nuclease family protein, partial [Candidatus Peregrinibacteria bacterium]|nr:GIY-YIG nuclease family protein [Candidatus Peregrinibacteria bacterium]
MKNLQKNIQALLKKLPQTPGVYKMKNSSGDILYVGKAKNLKNRVKSYFQNTESQGIRTQKLVIQIEDIEWVEVNSETEALILETNYIKELRPKYNILMKDDKNFVYVRIAVKDDFPKISIERKLKKDGAKYFGPKTSKGQLEANIDFLRKMFPLHTCNLEMREVTGISSVISSDSREIPLYQERDFSTTSSPAELGRTPVEMTEETVSSNKKSKVICKGHEKYPCLEYQMKRCSAPCIG